MSNFKYNLRKARKSRKMTQVELAEKIGASSQVVSNLERGYTNPRGKDIEKLAKALNYPVNSLISSDIKKDFEPIIFSDKAAFDSLPLSEQQRIYQTLQEQADFLVQRALKNNQQK
ncbi:MAG: helix-turn-helix transcriptional regulator [Staphylococcus simulans]|nr:helix-turn-helix transcriptional regulator [Staphylococcus simulans]MDK8315686.1 helix-turn-helix transcriptional regulator [Staphylococcus simulans]